MKTHEILPIVQAVIARSAHISVERVFVEARFVEDLKLDSLHMMDVAIGLEEKLDIEIPTEALMEVHSVKDLCEYLETRVSEEPAGKGQKA